MHSCKLMPGYKSTYIIKCTEISIEDFYLFVQAYATPLDYIFFDHSNEQQGNFYGIITILNDDMELLFKLRFAQC